MTHTTTLLRHEAVADGTMRFYFAKPAGFEYRAGQTIDLTLVNPPETDAEGNTRTFSLVSAPQDETLSIATRMRESAFKRVLKALPEGTDVQVDGPMGSFFLQENTSRPAVFLAGGIGVTPFHSMIVDAAHLQSAHELYLFYSNRRPEDAAFLSELSAIAAHYPRFHFVPTMTDMEKSSQSWEGERGYITAEMLQKYLPQGSMPIYYLAGPPTMVTAMRTLLNGMGVSNDDIRTEEFAGY
jgi:ferredoxin-NADP reductase